MPVMLALKVLRKEDLDLKTSLSCTVRFFTNKQTNEQANHSSRGKKSLRILFFGPSILVLS